MPNLISFFERSLSHADRLLVLMGLSLWLAPSFAQAPNPQEIGSPFLRWYSPRDYEAFYQNWGMIQDSRNFVYLANTYGILEYDGTRWKLIARPLGDTFFAIGLGPNDQIYAATEGDLGRLELGSNGDLKYASLKTLIPEKDQFFGRITQIISHDNSIFFLSRAKLFQFKNNQFKTYTCNSDFVRMHEINDTIYIEQRNNGLFKWDDGAFIQVLKSKSYQDDHIVSMSVLAPDQLLITTRFKGSFLWKPSTHETRAFKSDLDSIKFKSGVAHGMVLKDGSLAFSCYENGFFQVNPNGSIRCHIDKKTGLPDDMVRKSYLDHQGALWLLLGNGMARVELLSPLTRLDERQGLKGGVISMHRHRGTLHIGTNYGLYQMRQDAKGQTFPQLVPGVSDEVWTYCSWGGGSAHWRESWCQMASSPDRRTPKESR